MACAIALGANPTGAKSLAPEPKPSPIAAVIQVTVIPASRAAGVVRQLFPHVNVRVDEHANAVIVYGSSDDVQSARSVVAGLDVRNPQTPTVEVISLRLLKPQDVIARVAPLFPNASLKVASKSSVLLRAVPLDSTQINMHRFTTIFEARRRAEAWRADYNDVRPHSALGYRTLKEFAEAFKISQSSQLSAA